MRLTNPVGVLTHLNSLIYDVQMLRLLQIACYFYKWEDGLLFLSGIDRCR